MDEQVGALVTSAPGAGKTLVGVEVAKRLKAKVILIIAPQSTLFGSWGRTVARQGLATEVKLLVGTAAGKKNFEALRWRTPGVYVTTWQWFARQKWGSIEPDMVIADEIHMAASFGNVTQQRLTGHGNSKGLHAKYRLGLSGTPIRNKFENAWTIARWIEPAKMPLPFWTWRLRSCETVYDRFAPQQRKVVGELHPGELFNSLTCYIQHLQREKCCKFHPKGFLAHLPAPLHIERTIQMTPAQAKFYKEMERALASSLESPDETGKVPVVVELPIEARSMLRMCSLALPVVWFEDVDGAPKARLKFEDDAPSPKLDALIEDLPGYEGKHTLVLTHSKRFAKVAVDRLAKEGYTVEGWHGDITKVKRDKILINFTTGKVDIIVGVISAMGTGTDGLQEVCYNVSWLSRDDDTSNNIQGIGRLDRLGQSKQVVTRDYNSAETIDVGLFSKDLERILSLNRSLRRT
jgi:superfamily II DNA or RNA helicase